MILSNQLGALVTMRGQASDLGSNWLLTGNLDFSRDYLEAIQRVRPEDIARVARRYLRDDNCTRGHASTRRARTPRRAAAPASQEAGEIQQFELVQRPAPARARGCPAAAGLHGRRVPGRPARGNRRRQRADEAVFARPAQGHGEPHRRRNSPRKSRPSAAASAAMRATTASAFRWKSCSPTSTSVWKSWPTCCSTPPCPAEAVEREKTVQAAAIKSEDEHLTSWRATSCARQMFGSHPYALRSSGSPESRRRDSTAPQLEAFRKAYLVARQRRAGGFRQRRRGRGARAGGGALRRRCPPAKWRWPAAAAARGSRPKRALVEKFEDKEQAVLMIGYPGTTIGSQDRHALELIDEASSDLGSRFFIRIREELGLAYFVGSSQMVGLAPGMFTFYVGTDPLKVELVREAFTEEIARLAAERV